MIKKLLLGLTVVAIAGAGVAIGGAVDLDKD